MISEMLREEEEFADELLIRIILKQRNAFNSIASKRKTSEYFKQSVVGHLCQKVYTGPLQEYKSCVALKWLKFERN